MKASEFVSLCNEHTIDPDLAFENDDVRAALADGDDDEVRRIVEEDF